MKSFKHSTLALAALVTIQSFGFQSFGQTQPKPHPKPKPKPKQTQAQQPQPQVPKVTLDDLVSQLSDNDAIVAAQTQVGIARGQLRVARDSQLPTFVATAGPQVSNGQFSNAISATLTAPIFTGFVVQNQINAAKYVVAGQTYNIEWARAQVMANTKYYFYEIEKAIATQAAQQKAVTAATTLLNQSEEFLHLKQVNSPIDVANGEVALAQAKAAVAQAEATIKVNCHALLKMLQKDLSEQALCMNLTDTHPPVQPDLNEQEAESFALQNRPDLEQQSQTILANKATVKEYDPISALSVGVTVSDTRSSATSGTGGIGSNAGSTAVGSSPSALSDFTGLPSSSNGNDFRFALSGQYKFDPTRRGNRDTALWTQHYNEVTLDSNQRAVKQQVQDSYSNLTNAYQQAAEAQIGYKNQLLQYTIAKEQFALKQLSSLLYIQVIANTALAEAAYKTSQFNISEAINTLQLALGQVTADNKVASDTGGLP